MSKGIDSVDGSLVGYYWTVKMLCPAYQVIPAGPPAGAGQFGSADQRKQEKQSSGENPSQHP